MSKARVVVSKIISKQMSASEAAAAYGVSRQHIHRWLARYRDLGLTVWSRGHGDRIPIRGALPQRWRSGSSRYAASSPVKASITGRRGSAGTLNKSIS